MRALHAVNNAELQATGIAGEMVMEDGRDLMFPGWQVPYFVALAPGSPETLYERVDEAESAILVRLAELARRQEREMEQFALRDALDALYAIKIEKLDFPHCAPGSTV
jgi:hypothetical protein